MSSDPCRAVAQFDHIALATDNLECLRDFYRNLGAIASPISLDPGSSVRTCVLDFCGIRLALIEHPSRGEGAVGGGQAPVLLLGFALGSADAVDDLTGALGAAGHRILESPKRAGERGSYESLVLDPDGNLLKFTV